MSTTANTAKPAGRRPRRSTTPLTTVDTTPDPTPDDVAVAEVEDTATTSPTAPAEAVTPTDDVSPADTPAAESATPAAAEAPGEEVVVSWSDAVPWLALQVGSRPSVPEISIAVAVWRMLHHSPGATALRLAADAETVGVALDPAVVARVLMRYQRAGIATAVEDGAVTRWSPVSPAQIVAAVQRGMVNAASGVSGLSSGSRGVRAVVGTGGPAGGLRDAVAEYLAAHPGQEFSPTEIARGLGGRSVGAVSKACERLVGDGVAVRTCDRPSRYQHTAPATTDAVGAEITTTAISTDDGVESER
ncbi:MULTISPECIES: hypothetical protein [Pseudonocardia]|uniref:Uncharacterized protein n=2 Tax=Pseudonocardia TaxID=1847 RepID=A0A1Y2MIJ7_PSEAH|nr:MULTISPECIES: hypothetical protein [Pseudonocardia]OSY35094.1 hypothetical protein BG845_06327 [Pseudonocardia autotrophica]TDN72113.1 hypothetical protein C8E95_1160 [Pseudonocardia autotrophica]BBG02817.1 hypothetical protein Pdca_40260 [Pseudonocardia autotrophica]GEC26136.1 hypothetical protein PSA01_31650 [Pseudonocardia saturnea]